MVFQSEISIRQAWKQPLSDLEKMHYGTAHETAHENIKFFGVVINSLLPKCENRIWELTIESISSLFTATEENFQNELAALRVLLEDGVITPKKFEAADEVCVIKYKRKFGQILEDLKASCAIFCPDKNITILDPKRITHAQWIILH